MKKSIILLFLIAAIGANAQTVTLKIKSKALGDSIWVNRGAIEVTPILINSNTDTARSIDYYFNAARDTLGTASLTINLYNKAGSNLQSSTLPLSESLYHKWSSLIAAIDTYVQAQRKRLVKQ